MRQEAHRRERKQSCNGAGGLTENVGKKRVRIHNHDADATVDDGYDEVEATTDDGSVQWFRGALLQPTSAVVLIP